MASLSVHPLDAWQQSLAANFDDVTLRKLELPQEPVTFALEHGLAVTQRAELNEAIFATVERGSLRRKHFLCWAAYAAELGYLFAGDEYWHTFEEETPGWNPRNRPFIKSCFLLFAQEYNGAIPKGAWARHRSIICWPITHSILPKDLQRQLAEILYRIRHSVVMEDVASPRQLGRLIARHSSKATSRFRQLSSEPDLIGQIAAALLLEEQQLDLIEPRTLKRIAADLNVEEQARSWLRDARRHLSRTAQMKGLSRRPRATALAGERFSQPPRPPIRPRLVLRIDQDERWRLLLDVPDLTPLVRTFPDLQPIISKAQIHVGTFRRPMPARALLHGGQSFVQSEWPSSHEPLLVFEPSTRDLDALLDHSCKVDSPPWLFRVGVDGKAREIRSKRVAEGGEYIVVGPASVIHGNDFSQPVTIECENVIAHLFYARSLDDLTDYMSSLGLTAARRVVAQPVGIVPASWDREGAAEWLSTDQPMISLPANYAIDHYDIVLNVGTEDLTLTVQPASPTDTIFIKLPDLHAGIYHLSVTAHARDPSYRPELGDMEVLIRDPVPEDVHVRGRVAMMVVEDPTEATMQDLFEGSLRIAIIGPASRDVTATIRLLSRRKVKPLAELRFGGIHLPMTADDWARRISRLIDCDIEFSKAYQEANSCELEFDGGDLGRHFSAYDRPFEPLRWAVTYARNTMSITLYDDADNPEDVEVVRYEFTTPQTQRRVSDAQRKKAAQGEAVPGLYVARTGSYIASIVVPIQSLDSLKTAKPRFRRPERTEETVTHFLDGIDAWGHVSTIGNVFGRYAWRQSLKALIQQLSGLIAGTVWYKAELHIGRIAQPNLQLLANHIPFKRFGVNWDKQLPEAVEEVHALPIEDRVARLSAVTGESSDVCRFTLQLSSDPTDIRLTYGNLFGHMLHEVMRKSEIYRAARFMVLATSIRLEAGDSDARTLHVGWKWN